LDHYTTRLWIAHLLAEIRNNQKMLAKADANPQEIKAEIKTNQERVGAKIEANNENSEVL
jgi:hypothetical protein